MQIGTLRADRTFESECPDILNLAVSAAGIEDHFVLAALAVAKTLPRKIILSVDPWTFTYGVNQRWRYYKDEYEKSAAASGVAIGAAAAIDGSHEQSSSLRSKVRNLFSLNYTSRSFDQLMEDLKFRDNRFAPHEAMATDPSKGGVYPIILRDGSLIYSAQYITDSHASVVPLGGLASPLNQPPPDAHAIRDYGRLLHWIRSKGVEPIILLTPFHPNVWVVPDSPEAASAANIERIVRKLASNERTRVIGSYAPAAFGCQAAEFFDSMHASTRCIDRLK